MIRSASRACHDRLKLSCTLRELEKHMVNDDHDDEGYQFDEVDRAVVSIAG